ERILPGLKAETGRDAVPVTWADLSRFYKAPHYLRHDHAGLLAHVLQGPRGAALGLAYYDGRIVLEQAMAFTGQIELAGSVFLAEGAHMTDFFYLDRDGRSGQREGIWDAYHPGGGDIGSHGHAWFEPTDYYSQIGETYMIGFVMAFAGSYDLSGWGFTHETTEPVALEIREIVLGEEPPPPPPPPSGVTVVVDGMMLPPESGQIIGDRTWVRLRSFEAAGYAVEWNPATRTATLTRPA
ncbi:MAG: hypothetical protein ACREJ4_02605, partial [Candidatus Methylomirabilaceae bacterium]